MEENKNALLTPSPEWSRGSTQSIDFIVTEDCNLRCKYCYICNKKADKVMSIETAKKFIDYLFSDKFVREESVILGFIGGEPFLEVDLIDEIVDYFKCKAYELNDSWWWKYRISITTNGVNYSSPSVQRFINKNKNKASITITVDGTKEKHDMQRVFPNGKGSYDIIAKNIPLYLSQFPGTTKMTFAHDDLCLIKESVIHLWDIGITDISANIVFEDVWQDGDDIVFEEQLKSLADYIIDNDLYVDKYVSFFDEYIGKPLTDEHMHRPVCGAGRMMALGPSGKIYPCLRYKDYSLESDKEEVVIGDVDNGIDFDKVLRFRVSTYPMQCDDECLNCEIALGCMFCQGQSYDSADTQTNFQRSKAICDMYKARVRANNYYFNKLFNLKNVSRADYANEYKKLYFICDSNYITFCEMKPTARSNTSMSREDIIKGLDYCSKNFYTPVFLHPNNIFNEQLFDKFDEHRITHILPAKFYQEARAYKNCIFTFDMDTYKTPISFLDYIILNIEWSDIKNLSEYSLTLFQNTDRINLNIIGEYNDQDLIHYKQQLEILKEYLVESWTKLGVQKELNKISDPLFSSKQTACKCGKFDFAYAPDGKIYSCPLSYLLEQESVGDISDFRIKIKNQHLYTLEHSPLCKICPSKHCVRCFQKNIYSTREVNIPSQKKCKISFMEHNISVEFKEQIAHLIPYMDFTQVQPIQYNSPYEHYESIHQSTLGFNVK